MYLANNTIDQEKHYFLRESLLVDGAYASRELMSLGPDPSSYIVYPGGSSFYIHEEVEEQLSNAGVDPDYDDLEKIFWPFVRPDIKRALRGFFARDERMEQSGALTGSEEEFIRHHLHPVDKRRYNYLRLGELDQSRLGSLQAKFYRPLVFKSRDELEHMFMEMETRLGIEELSLYVYSFLYLRRYFSEIIAGQMPQGLDQEVLEELFITEICDLNRDDHFWKGASKPHDLHSCLVRYVIMFFDYPLASDSFLRDHMREFIAGTRRRAANYPRIKPEFSSEEASRVMGVSSGSLKAMTGKELTTLFRKRAAQVHPDKGGDHEKFIKLMEIYRTLLKRKK